MTSTQKFEGPDMAALLDEVHSTLGPNARVIAANRCRSGGVAGFFARESFEVTVEVPDVPQRSKASAGRKRRRVGGAAENAAMSVAEFGSTITIDPRDSRSALEQLIDAADRADELAPAAARAAKPAKSSNEKTRVEQAKPRGTIRASHSSGAARRVTDQRELVEASTVREVATPSEARPRREEHDPRSTALQTRSLDFGTVLDRAEVEHTSVALAVPRTDSAVRTSSESGGPSKGAKSHKMFRRRSKSRPVEGPVDRIIDLSSLEDGDVNASLAPRTTSARSQTKSQAVQEPLGQYIQRGDVPAVDLATLGVPAQWLTGAINGRVLIDSVLTRIPSPPPIVHAPGAILAFVGEGEMCLNTARAVAVALKQDPANCVFLSPGDRPGNKACVHIKAIDELSIRRASWVQDDQVTVVAIDAGFARPDVAWGRHAISVLHPSLRWGVVSATRKVEDIYGWARGIGGLHALAVNGMYDTASPASILAAGVPVARIDGQIASTDLWRKLLDDRLAEAATRRTPDLITT